MVGVQVRRAGLDDLDGLLALFHELSARPDAAPADHATSLPILTTILADPARHLMVAVDGPTVVGSADLLLIPNLTHHGKPFAVIENVIVTAASRRTGVGRAVIRHLIEVARDAGCYKVQLHSGKQRTEAHEFYRQLGFQPIAEGFKLYF